MDCLDTASPFLPLPESLAIAPVSETDSQLVVQVVCTSQTTCCPHCQRPSDRVDSWGDPSGKSPVHLSKRELRLLPFHLLGLH